MEPSSQDVRQALGRPVLLRCSLLRGSPQRIASAVWRFKGQLLPPPPVLPAAAAETPDHAELRLDALTRDSSGSYECSVSNDVGSATCLFQVSGERPVGPTPACSPTPSWDQALSHTPTSTPTSTHSLTPRPCHICLGCSFLLASAVLGICLSKTFVLLLKARPLKTTPLGPCSVPFFGPLQPRPFQMPHSRFSFP